MFDCIDFDGIGFTAIHFPKMGDVAVLRLYIISVKINHYAPTTTPPLGCNTCPAK